LVIFTLAKACFKTFAKLRSFISYSWVGKIALFDIALVGALACGAWQCVLL